MAVSIHSIVIDTALEFLTETFKVSVLELQ